MWDFIANYLLFRGGGHPAKTAFDIIFSGYLVGIIFWSVLMYGLSGGREDKVGAAYWAQGIGSILFIRLFFGHDGLVEFNHDKVHYLRFIVNAGTAMIGYRIFLKGLVDNVAGNVVFCLVASAVYSIWVGDSLLSIFLAPFFVVATSFVINAVEYHRFEAFMTLAISTAFLGALWYFFVIR